MGRLTMAFLGLVLFGVSLLSVWGFSIPGHNGPGKGNTPFQTEKCVVKVVFDGDTLGCDLDGNHRISKPDEHIRLLGIDATEMHYSRKNTTGRNEPYALEAKRFVEKRVLNQPVYLEYDIKRFDKYDRRLAYVYLDDKRERMLNGLLLKQGLARVLFIGVNRRYEQAFLHLQQQAQNQHLGLWHTR